MTDPEGDPLVLTLADNVVAGPEGDLTAETPTKDSVRLKAGGTPGPGVLTFEVSDRAKLSDPDAHVVTLSVPVQIGAGAPIISCPGTPLPIIEGGPARTFDVASLCHVWTPNPADAVGLTFTAAWAQGQQPADVDLSPDDAGFKLQAGVSSRGQTGTVAIGTEGTEATGSLIVQVVSAGPPTLSPISLETQASKSVSVDVAAYARSPFGDAAKWAVTDVAPAAGSPAPSQKGTTLTFTPTEFGIFSYQVTLADDGGVKGSTRPTATGQIDLAVVDKPEAPTGLRWDQQKQDSQVLLSWGAPNANGGAIQYYTVYFQGPGGSGTQKCPAPRCTITGLNNGAPYRFEVTATNAYGESERSNAAEGTADRVPDQVSNLAVKLQRDHQVTLTWSPPATAGDYSAIKRLSDQVARRGQGLPDRRSHLHDARDHSQRPGRELRGLGGERRRAQPAEGLGDRARSRQAGGADDERAGDERTGRATRPRASRSRGAPWPPTVPTRSPTPSSARAAEEARRSVSGCPRLSAPTTLPTTARSTATRCKHATARPRLPASQTRHCTSHRFPAL